MNPIQLKVFKIDTITQYSIYLFSNLVFTLSSSKDKYWFRFLGVGLRVKPNKEQLTFSERTGHTKFLKIGEKRISIIT